MSDIAIKYDLRRRLGPPRDQGQRPTCLAFAVSDTHAAVRDGWAPLSCEYLYYHAVHIDGAGPEDGATLAAILVALDREGQPVEAAWPYLTKPPTDPALWLPPTDVGEVFHRSGENTGRSFDHAWSLVSDRRPAVIVLTLSDAFYLPQDGVVDATEPPDPARRHAVVAVATGHRGSSRLLLVRNSWGSYWGKSGHAWVAEAYLAPRIIGILALKEDA